MKKSRILKILLLSLMGFTALTSVGLAAWVNTTNEISTSTTVDKTTKKAVCYNKQTGARFTNLRKACELATNNQDIYVIPGSVWTETKSFTIPNTVDVFVPFINEQWDYEQADYCGPMSADYPFTSIADNNAANKVSSMTLAENVTMTIDGGLYLGAESGSFGVARKYSEILLSPKSSIISNGIFTCLGYVKETKGIYNPYRDSASNPVKPDNSNDEGRLVEIRKGTLTVTGSIYDLKGGSGLKGLTDLNICPFSEFSFTNIQTYTKIYHNAVMKAVAVISLQKYNVETKDDGIAFKSGFTCVDKEGADSLFYFANGQSGYFGMEYIPKDKTGRYTNSAEDHVNIYCNGHIKQGYLKLQLKVGKIPVNVNTSNYFLPINYRMSIFVCNSGKYSTSYNVKFLNGSYVKNLPGGTISLEGNSKVVVYDKLALSAIKDNSYVNRFSKRDDALFINNGKLLLNSTTCAFGGRILTDEGVGNQSSIEILNGTKWNNLAVTSYETLGANPVSIFTKAEFANASGGKVSKALTKDYTSNVSIIKHATDKTCWQDSYSLPTIHKYTVNAVLSGSSGETISYEMSMSPNASDSNKLSLTSDFLLESAIFEIPDNMKAKVNIKLGRGVFQDQSMTFTNNSYIDVKKDIVLNVKPVITIDINFHNEGGSGCGGMTYEYQIFDNKTGGSAIDSGTITAGGTIKVLEGKWIKLVITIGTHNPLTSGSRAYFDFIKINGVLFNDYRAGGTGLVGTPRSATFRNRLEVVPNDKGFMDVHVGITHGW